MLLGIPSWVYGLLAGLLLLLYFIIEYATRLRLQIAPNIKLDFEPSGGCLVATPISDIQNGQIIRTVQGMYARIKVTNTGVLAAKECEAALIGLSRERCDKLWEQINLHDTFDLPWSLRPGREYLPMAIGVGLRRYFDVFYTREDTNEIHMIGGWPLRLTEVFKKPGVYKFEVAVLSEGVTTKREIVVEWTGTWNAIKFR